MPSAMLPSATTRPAPQIVGVSCTSRCTSSTTRLSCGFLRGIEEGGRHVVDLGGHLGVKYRVYRRLWSFPSDLRWTVCETSDVVRAARDLPPEDLLPGLTFTSDRASLADADILFASGVLQYLEEPLHSILAGLPRRPRHLVLNKVPLTDGPEIWTIQNVGAALVPYHVMNRGLFLDGDDAARVPPPGFVGRGRVRGSANSLRPAATGRSRTPGSPCPCPAADGRRRRRRGESALTEPPARRRGPERPAPGSGRATLGGSGGAPSLSRRP